MWGSEGDCIIEKRSFVKWIAESSRLADRRLRVRLAAGAHRRRPGGRPRRRAPMVMDRRGGTRKHLRFRDILDELPPRSLLVLNDARVLPARLRGRKPTGGAVEFLLTQRMAIDQRDGGRQNGRFCELWEGLARGLGGDGAGRAPIDVGGGVERRGRRAARRGTRAAAADGAGAVAARACSTRSARCRCRRTSRPRAGAWATAAPAVDDRARYQTVYAASAGRRGRADRGPALHAARCSRRSRAAGHEIARAHAARRARARSGPVEADDPRAHRLDAERYRIPPRRPRRDRARAARAAAGGGGRHDGGARAGGVGAGARRRGRARATRRDRSLPAAGRPTSRSSPI